MTTPFFVYGSLRPDDITKKPWREDWLRDSLSKKGRIKGTMYDDVYASVVLSKSEDASINVESTVQGWLVEYSDEIYARKLKEADIIEGYPDFYTREKVLVSCHDGSLKMAWCYVRPNCSKKTEVIGGDWLLYNLNKNKKTN
jgi:gamma-glutamylcyclotransferase (GGCT)/AIG2-like uncharacterized protein YtfP